MLVHISILKSLKPITEIVKFPFAILAITIIAGCAAAPPRPASVARDDYTSTEAYITKLIQYEMSLVSG